MNSSGSLLGGRSGRFGRGFGLSSASASPLGRSFLAFWERASVAGKSEIAAMAASRRPARANRDRDMEDSVGVGQDWVSLGGPRLEAIAVGFIDIALRARHRGSRRAIPIKPTAMASSRGCLNLLHILDRIQQLVIRRPLDEPRLE